MKIKVTVENGLSVFQNAIREFPDSACAVVGEKIFIDSKEAIKVLWGGDGWNDCYPEIRESESGKISLPYRPT